MDPALSKKPNAVADLAELGQLTARAGERSDGRCVTDLIT